MHPRSEITLQEIVAIANKGEYAAPANFIQTVNFYYKDMRIPLPKVAPHTIDIIYNSNNKDYIKVNWKNKKILTTSFKREQVDPEIMHILDNLATIYKKKCGYISFSMANAPDLVSKVTQMVSQLTNEPHSNQDHLSLKKAQYYTSLERLLEKINQVIEMVEQQHQIKLKKCSSQMNELVTILVFNEFSFYTFMTPLSLAEYQKIIVAVKKSAAKLSPNIHLVLASFPVIGLDNKLHNSVLYIQSPIRKAEAVNIYHLNKNYYSNLDPIYFDTMGKAYQNYNLYDEFEHHMTDDDNSEDSPKQLLKEAGVNIDDVNQYRGAFKVSTQNGNSFFILIEICFDHLMKIAFSQLEKLIHQLEKNYQSVPKQAVQVIASNFISLSEFLVSQTIIHADPFYSPSPRKTISLKSNFGNSLKLNIYDLKPIKEIPSDILQEVTPHRSKHKDLELNIKTNGFLLVNHMKKTMKEKIAKAKIPQNDNGIASQANNKLRVSFD